MKDKYIERKLNLYVEAVKPQNRVIDDAIFELRQRQSQKTIQPYPVKRKTGMFFGIGAAAAASLAILIFLTVTIVNVVNKPPVYALTDLEYRAVTISEIQSAANILTLDAGESYTNGRIYHKEGSDAPVVITMLYKTVGAGGLDEIIVIADLLGGLKDYTDFKQYTKTAIEGTTVHRRQVKENGEYFTECFFSSGGVDYYVIITSPVQSSANEYIALLLSS